MPDGIISRWVRFRDGQGRGWFCPDDAELAAFIDGKLDGSAKEHTLRHLADCSHCLAQVAELTRLQTGEAPVEVPAHLLARGRGLVGTTQAGTRRPLVRWGAIAAAAACMALIVATTYRQPLPPPAVLPTQPPPPRVRVEPVTPTPNQPEAQRAVRNMPNRAVAPQLLYPREGAAVAPGGIEFRWQAVPGTLYYDVRLISEEGDVIWEARTEKSEASLPSDVDLTAGQGFYVRVQAWLAEGKTVTSRAVSFRVENPS